MAHKCTHSGCAFYLPDSYPVPLCPWHAVPGKGVAKVAAAAGIFVVGVCGGLAYTAIKKWKHEKKVAGEREEWKAMMECGDVSMSNDVCSNTEETDLCA